MNEVCEYVAERLRTVEERYEQACAQQDAINMRVYRSLRRELFALRDTFPRQALIDNLNARFALLSCDNDAVLDLEQPRILLDCLSDLDNCAFFEPYSAEEVRYWMNDPRARVCYSLPGVEAKPKRRKQK